MLSACLTMPGGLIPLSPMKMRMLSIHFQITSMETDTRAEWTVTQRLQAVSSSIQFYLLSQDPLGLGQLKAGFIAIHYSPSSFLRVICAPEAKHEQHTHHHPILWSWHATISRIHNLHSPSRKVIVKVVGRLASYPNRQSPASCSPCLALECLPCTRMSSPQPTQCCLSPHQTTRVTAQRSSPLLDLTQCKYRVMMSRCLTTTSTLWTKKKTHCALLQSLFLKCPGTRNVLLKPFEEGMNIYNF